MKYDERLLYFYVNGFDPQADTLYIPLDTTPKTGSTYCENYDIRFAQPCDFVIAIDGQDNSRVVVQERYEVLKAAYWESYYVLDPYINNPSRDSPRFVPIHMAMKLGGIVPNLDMDTPAGESYETGKLRHGNASPDAPDFDEIWIIARRLEKLSAAASECGAAAQKIRPISMDLTETAAYE